jgi:hypothetical protein
MLMQPEIDRQIPNRTGEGMVGMTKLDWLLDAIAKHDS